MGVRSVTLDQLTRLCHDGEWRRAPYPAAPSGFAELDANLPGGGWPVGAIAELMPEARGIDHSNPQRAGIAVGRGADAALPGVRRRLELAVRNRR